MNDKQYGTVKIQHCIYLTSSKQIPQIKMSTFLDEAENSLDACRQKSDSKHSHIEIIIR